MNDFIFTETTKLYKYLPFTKHSLNVITNGTIKFTQPSLLNDPFDSAPDYDNYNVEEYFNTRPDLIDKVVRYLNIRKDEFLYEKSKMAARLKNAITAGYFGQPLSDKVGICSLTRTPLNLLMWAHYAGSHTGFVVEFETPLEAISEKKPEETEFIKWLVASPVKYQREKPVINLFDNDNTASDKRFFIKGEDWKYEQEERVMAYSNGAGIYEYDQKSILKSVFAGMKMSSTNFSTLERSIYELSTRIGKRIKLYQVKPDNGRFGICIPERKDLQIETRI